MRSRYVIYEHATLPLTLGKTNIDPLEWVRYSRQGEAPNLICIYMGPKYEVPSNNKTPFTTKKRARAGKPAGRVMVPAPNKKEKAPDIDDETTPRTMPTPDGK